MTDPLPRLTAALSDRYLLERELGQGGMATVYLAEDLKHKRKVALKVLKPELAAVLGAERFVQEIATTAALQHPHILPLFDSGTADGFLYYVMPFIDGETLRSKLDRETQLGVDEAVKITTDVADALDYAHSLGVIHRDIKPENILLHNGRPMVADFGIALALSAAAGGRMTETGLSLGTPHYMSPEQATAEKEITARSDIYSLGSVCYEMLAGQPPHLGGSAQQIIMKIVTEEATPVTQHRKSVPLNVAAAVAKSLEKLPADRFESAKAFAEALQNPGFMVAGTVAMGGVARGGMRGRVNYALAGVAVAALALAAWAWTRHSAPALGSIVRFSVPVAEGTIPRNTLTRQMAFSPDGTRLVFAARDAGRWTLYERRLDGATDVLFAASDTASYIDPFFSPDGAWLGFVAGIGRSRQLRRMSVADGTVRVIAPMDSINGIVGLTWGDDGTIVAATRSRLYRVPASGGQWSVLAEANPLDGEVLRWYQPQMLPGSKVLLLHATDSYDPERANIVALTLATGERRTVLANGMNPIYVPEDYLLFVREGRLMGVGFDPDRAEARGEPVQLEDGVMQSLRVGNSRWESGAAEFAVSRAGHLAYASGGVGRTRTGRVVRLTTRGDTIPIAVEPRSWGTIRLSPNGALLMISLHLGGQQTGIWIHDLARDFITWPLETGGYSNWPMAWSPDSRSIVFSSDRDRPGLQNLYRMPSDGSGTPERLTVSDHPQLAADWSSQDVITYLQCENDEGQCDIWVIPPDSAPRPFVATPAREGYQTFSPDGRWLAYVSNQSGRDEVYVRPYPEGEPATQVSTGGGDSPMWSRDGRTLLFEGRNAMMAADVAPGNSFYSGRPRPYLVPWRIGSTPVRTADIFPDGSVVVAVNDSTVPAQPSGATQIEVILNFATELQERVRP